MFPLVVYCDKSIMRNTEIKVSYNAKNLKFDINTIFFSERGDNVIL